MTHRQFLVWSYWLDLQWNQPDRHDNYLMMLACEVRRVLAKEPNHIHPKDFRLEFTTKKTSPPAKPESAPPSRQARSHKAQITAVAKSRWFGAVGLKPDNG